MDSDNKDINCLRNKNLKYMHIYIYEEKRDYTQTSSVLIYLSSFKLLVCLISSVVS